MDDQSEGTPFGTNIWSQRKNTILGVRLKLLCFLESQNIINKDNFWYFTASYEKMRIRIVSFSIFLVKTRNIQCSKCLTLR